jgi:hypothetical protein
LNESIKIIVVLIKGSKTYAEISCIEEGEHRELRLIEYPNRSWISIKLSEAQEEAKETFIVFRATADDQTASLWISRTLY